ncbi:MAG: hypothetical protein Kow0010_01960 [Dehalococcoidia bacterium]
MTQQTQPPPITMSEATVELIKQAIENADVEEAVVRFSVKREDDTIRHTIGLEREPSQDDAVFEDQGLTIVVSPAHLPLLKGAHFDFQPAAEGEGQLVVSNPNFQ